MKSTITISTCVVLITRCPHASSAGVQIGGPLFSGPPAEWGELGSLHLLMHPRTARPRLSPAQCLSSPPRENGHAILWAGNRQAYNVFHSGEIDLAFFLSTLAVSNVSRSCFRCCCFAIAWNRPSFRSIKSSTGGQTAMGAAFLYN